MDTLNAPYVVSRLAADKVIQMANLQLVPIADLSLLQEPVPASQEQLDLIAGVFRQAFVLSAKVQVVGDLGKEVVTSDRLFEGEDVVLQMTGGSSPTQKRAQAVLKPDVMADSKAGAATQWPPFLAAGLFRHQ